MLGLLNNRVQVLLNLGATTATGNSTTFSLPIADSYKLILDVGAATGTTPTLDVAIQESPDAGTTWYTFERFAQITAASTRNLIFTPTLAVNQSASEGAVANTGGALAVNAPFVQKYVRVLYTISGTTPSFASIKLWLVSVASGQSGF